MSWLRDRKEAVWAALGIRRSVILGILAACLKVAELLVEWMAQYLPEPLGGPAVIQIGPFGSWAIGAFLALLLFSYWVIEYAVKLREELRPKIKLSFNPNQGCLITTPIKTKTIEKTLDGDVERSTERRGLEIRAMVSSESEKAVQGCTPYLVGIRKKDPVTGVYLTTNYIDDLELPWHMGYRSPITLPRGIRRYFNIIMIDENVKQPRLNTGWPLTLRNILDDKTTYELELAVTGDGISVGLKIEFTWTGDLDTVTAKQIWTGPKSKSRPR